MRDVTIRDCIGKAKELTAEEVRKSPVGTRIIRHSFDRYGTHQWREMTVVQSGCSHALAYRDVDMTTSIKKITKETDRVCYTAAE
jgi:hypothetical protein